MTVKHIQGSETSIREAFARFMRAKYREHTSLDEQVQEAQQANIGYFKQGDSLRGQRFVTPSEGFLLKADHKRSLFDALGWLLRLKRNAPKTGWYLRRAEGAVWVWLGESVEDATNWLDKLSKRL